MRKSEMFWWGVIAAVLASSAYGYTYHDKLTRGYCAREGRFLAEQELIDIAVTNMLNESAAPANRKLNQTKDQLKYKDIQDYYEQVSGCCQIALATPKTITASSSVIRHNSRAYGLKYYVVEMKYQDQSTLFFKKNKLISACGRLHPNSKKSKRKTLNLIFGYHEIRKTTKTNHEN